ncbi:MAG TPA: hypothetical protein VM204_04825, partial [Gaiellaceae bacterium]|nr:hypothetical protein [Gaiellaceae bacterium]
MIVEAISRLLDGRDLPRETAREVMGEIMRGEATPAQIGGFLVGLRLKGETPAEIAGCAEAMREHVLPVRPRRDDLVDTAGTGGDGGATINISTAAAIVAAAAGAGVAKHGNRAVSSACGSADVLEALGFRLEQEPDAEETARLPCFATPAPAAAATIAAAVEMLIVAAPSPPVPAVSTRSSRRGRTGSTCSRIASAQPAISSAVSPFARSATRKPAICACVASPRMISSITSRARARPSERPSRRSRSASW